MTGIEQELSSGENPPEYLFDLIKLSIYAQEGKRDEMSQAAEAALDKGADGKQLLKALFRAEKFHQMSVNEKNRLIKRGVDRLTVSRLFSEDRLPVSVQVVGSVAQRNS